MISMQLTTAIACVTALTVMREYKVRFARKVAAAFGYILVSLTAVYAYLAVKPESATLEAAGASPMLLLASAATSIAALLGFLLKLRLDPPSAPGRRRAETQVGSRA